MKTIERPGGPGPRPPVPWKPLDLDTQAPRYLAIADAVARDVASGRLQPGERLPTNRALADLLGVDLSTITRAFRECARRGLVAGTAGRGTFVSMDVGVSMSLSRPRDPRDAALLEMGLVLPLYSVERKAMDLVRASLATVDLGRFLRYADPAGMPEHRRAGARWLARSGLNVKPQNVLVASGSQNAITCCLMSLFGPGDRVAVDALTFPGLKAAARLVNVRLVPIAMDEGGMIPDALASVCRRDRIKGLYLMPEVQNPTTGSLPPERREQIARLIERNDLILIEDDAFGHTSGRHVALSARVPDNGVFLGGTSKVFGAGLRCSFVAAPTRFMGPLEAAVMSTVWMASPLTTEIAARIAGGSTVETLIQAKNKEAGARMALAVKRLGDYNLRTRPTGFFCWLELPRGWTGRRFELAAREGGVRLYCAEKFAVGNAAVPEAARVSLTGSETRADLGRGLDILAEILATGPGRSEAIL